MANNYQFLRGTQAENDAYVGEEGSITVDQTNLTLRLHDGVTEGGTQLCSIATILGDLSGKTLDVDISGNASTADQADNATRAVNADRADQAGTASRANNADNASRAAQADNADRAAQAGNSDNLEGSNKAYFRNASNLNTGTLSLSRLASSVLTKSNLSGEFNLVKSGNHSTLILPNGVKISYGEFTSGSYVNFASSFSSDDFAPVAISYNSPSSSDQSVVCSGKSSSRVRFQTYTASGNQSNTGGFYIAIGE